MHPIHCDSTGSDMCYNITQDVGQSFYHQRRQTRPPVPVQYIRRPWRSWVAISYDESSGEVSEESSPNMRPYRNDILHEAKQKFRERIKNDMLRDKPEELTAALRSRSRMSRHGDEGEGFMDFEDGAKRSRSATIQLEAAREPVSRPKKAGKVITKSSFRTRDPVSHSASFSSHTEQDDIQGEKVVQFPVNSSVEWQKWMYDALCALQQLGCRTMAKEWIKAIHPKKQSTNPYNGRNPKTGKTGNPDDIKPVYWPEDVVHKEPDHINKEERLKLLLHLLMKTPHKILSPLNEAQNAKEIGAKELMSALQGKFENVKYGLKNKMSIVQKIIEVRTYLEQYEDGGLNKNTVLGVPDYASSRRNNKNDDDGVDGAMEDALEVIPDYGEYNEDDVSVSAPTSIDPLSNGNEIPVLPQASLEKSDESRGRTKVRRKAKRASARSNTDSMPGKTYVSWDPSRLPSDYGIQAAQMPRYDNLTHHTVDNNGIGMAQQMHHPMSWDPMNESVNFPPQYHDPNLADHRVVANLNVDPSQFMSREYAMMPQQQFCGPHPYFQHSPGANMPFHYDPSPIQGFDQAAHAYFPPTSRPM